MSLAALANSGILSLAGRSGWSRSDLARQRGHEVMGAGAYARRRLSGQDEHNHEQDQERKHNRAHHWVGANRIPVLPGHSHLSSPARAPRCARGALLPG
jgi:hypothetical protein